MLKSSRPCLGDWSNMKTGLKIPSLASIFVIVVSVYLFVVLSGYLPYDEGIFLYLYSDYSLKSEKYPAGSITVITDEDLKDVPELRELIHKALSKEYPLNTVGGVPVTFENLDRFQRQYAEILAAKYSKNSADFFTYDYSFASDEDLADNSTHYIRVLECGYFEYDCKQYGLSSNCLRFPSVESDDQRRLEVYEIRQPLQEGDHVWAVLSEERISLMPSIIDAIADIGQYQEGIKVRSLGLPPSTVDRHKDWKTNILDDYHSFEYNGKIFLITFWIA